MTAGMILIDTTAKAPPIPREELWKGFAMLAEQKGVDAMVAGLVPQMLTGDARLNNPGLVDSMGRLVKAASVQGAVAGAGALATRPDLTGVLPTIKVPTLIMVGQEDTVTPIAWSQDMHRAIDGSELVIIEGASHASILEQPRQANRAILEWASSAMAAGGPGD